MADGLAFHQAPPLSAPLRFFLTAPWFGLAAAAVLAWGGPAALASRWTPATLAATHLLTLGMLSMTMVGALIQLLSVVAGAPLRHPHRVAGIVHVCLTLGTALLATGFLGFPLLLTAALPLLVTAFAVLIVSAAQSLWTSSASGPTPAAIGLSLFALAVTVGFGLLLGLAYSGHLPASQRWLADLHPTWGMVGWIGILAAGVSYQVVPMFQMTPPYPPRLTRWLAPGLLTALAGLSAAAPFAAEGLSLPFGLAGAAVAAGLVLYGATTLALQHRRRRSRSNPQFAFFRIGMASLLGAGGFWATAQAFPNLGQRPEYPLLLGVLMLGGFALSLVIGMLYKIVPFLVWLHLRQRAPKLARLLPTLERILPEARGRINVRAHLATLITALGAAMMPSLVYLASLALAAASVWLGISLAQAARTLHSATPPNAGKVKDAGEPSAPG